MKHLIFAGALVAGLAFAGLATADPPGPREACAADFQKLCPDAKPGPGGGLRECVQAHFSQFSTPCQQAIQAMRARMQQQQGATNATGH
jgi:hypothetical protein